MKLNRNISHGVANGETVSFKKGDSMSADHAQYELFKSKGYLDNEVIEAKTIQPNKVEYKESKKKKNKNK